MQCFGQTRGSCPRWVKTIDPQAAQQIQPELMSGESVYWAGMPNPRIIFHSDDWTAIPFTLIWTGFFLFWEADALGMRGKASRHGEIKVFMALWGIPFLVIGNWMVWGRFLADAWLKRRTYYAVTNLRVLVLQDGWKKKTSTTFLEPIPMIEREGAVTGTLWSVQSIQWLRQKEGSSGHQSVFNQRCASVCRHRGRGFSLSADY
jgi:hypothetical protein